MKTHSTNKVKLLFAYLHPLRCPFAYLPICLFSLFGCGSVITQEAAQQAVDDAQISVQLARSARADLYSPGNLNDAERFLAEAEQALLRNRRQRAYSLANKALDASKAGEVESKQRLERLQTASPLNQFPQPGGLTPYSTTTQPFTQFRQGTERIPSNLTSQEQSLLEMQNRVQAAAQALQEAQNTVQAARLLVLKVQTEIGLSMAETTLQQVRESRASKEMIDLIQSWYEQARQAAVVGNYENALYFLERAQTYAQDARSLAPKK